MTEECDVLSPVGIERFFEEYWELKPLHIARAGAGPICNLLNVSDIERVLSTHDLDFPRLQMTQAGKPIDVDQYTDGESRIIPSRVLELHASGATLVLSQAQRLIPALSTLCRQTQSALQLQCQTNVYLSPPGFQGFRAHYDTHDVLILQVAGKKTFNFYSAASELPLQHQKFNAEKQSAGDLTESIELAAGDTLYIPRGFIHDAVALDQQESLHITLGVYAVTVQELLQSLLQLATERDVTYRRSIPRDLWVPPPVSGSHNKNTMDKSTFEFADRLRDELPPGLMDPSLISEALSLLRDEFALSCKQDAMSGLTRAVDLSASSVQVRHDALLNSEQTSRGVMLRSQGRILEFQQPMADAVVWLLEQPRQHSIEVSEIPDLSPSQREALVEKLISENIVFVCHPPDQLP